MKIIDEKIVNELRYVASTEISTAGSGHTGICLGSAPIFYTLFSRFLKNEPSDVNYFNRDRLVVCAGHMAPLYYALGNLFGYDVSKNDLENLRKNGSKTKGHLSLNHNMAIEATSGPLGQGLPMAVGMAIAENKLAHEFNKPRFSVVDHYTYCFVSDGCLMEGVTNECAGIAGTLGLNKLIVIYDSNNITINGSTDLAFVEDTLLRFKSLGWNTLEVKNGNDVDEIASAIMAARNSIGKPTIIKVNTQIGFGSVYAGKSAIHGKALSAEELELLRVNLGVNLPKFEFSAESKTYAENINFAKQKQINKEKQLVDEYAKMYPAEFAKLNAYLENEFAQKVDFASLGLEAKAEATRESSGRIINALAEKIPNLIVGTADLAPSTKVYITNGGDYSRANPLGRNLHFGVREQAMVAICNGIVLHGGFKVVCSTFMVFSDYARHAIRMSALMSLPLIMLFSHDSIGVGEDGATHQPIEYNEMYRATPNLNFVRPADFNEMLGAYKLALLSARPTIISATRQTVPLLERTDMDNTLKGAYVVVNPNKPEGIIISSGSELALAVKASKILADLGKKVRVVSVPCLNVFEESKPAYKERLLPDSLRARLAVEAGNASALYKYVGLDGDVLQITQFGHTAKKEELFEEFGITVQNIVDKMNSLI